MVAAGSARRTYDPATRPVVDLVRGLTARDDLDHVRIERPGLVLELTRSV
jgi:hypothetical protein